MLHEHCAAAGRDAAEIRCAVNVGLAWSEESLRHQFGAIADFVRPGVLGGSIDQVVDRIGEYVDAGADQVNLALRAPFDLDAVERFAAAMHLALIAHPENCLRTLALLVEQMYDPNTSTFQGER